MPVFSDRGDNTGKLLPRPRMDGPLRFHVGEHRYSTFMRDSLTSSSQMMDSKDLYTFVL